MNQSMKEELKRLKRKKKLKCEDLDLIFFHFYLAGEFKQKIPVDFGRDAFQIVIDKFTNPLSQ